MPKVACGADVWYTEDLKYCGSEGAVNTFRLVTNLCWRLDTMNSLSFDSSERKSSVTLTEVQRKAEQEKVRNHLGRAREAGTPATLTLNQWLSTLDEFDWMCAYCHNRPYRVLEHARPLSAGGGTTVENCFPSCLNCNARKFSQIATYDAATKSFQFVPNPDYRGGLPKAGYLKQPHLSVPTQQNTEMPFAIALTRAIIPIEATKPSPAMQESQFERKDRWLTEEQVFEKFTKTCSSKEIYGEVLTYMVHMRMIVRSVSGQRIRYRLSVS